MPWVAPRPERESMVLADRNTTLRTSAGPLNTGSPQIWINIIHRDAGVKQGGASDAAPVSVQQTVYRALCLPECSCSSQCIFTPPQQTRKACCRSHSFAGAEPSGAEQEKKPQALKKTEREFVRAEPFISAPRCSFQINYSH